ncbi:hypothetical protein LEN26_005375 [Aphanomyces euteiches]|nr:hypothetical protein LEN26_005375 [Aphanomyces euteiches]
MAIKAAMLRITLGDPLMKSESRQQINHLCNLRIALESIRYLEERRVLSKNLGQLSILPHLRVHEFVQEVRVCHETFAFLVHKVEESLVFTSPTSNKQSPVWLQVACAFHRLGHYGKGGSCGMIARAKGVGYGTVLLYTSRVLKALKELASEEIAWPDKLEREHLANTNHNRHGFGGGILSTDGTHVVLFQKPSLDGEACFSRKKTYSINLLLTFDYRRLLIAGWPGSVHDATVWKSCDVFKNPTNYFSKGQYQFGDSGFGMSLYMLVPYRLPYSNEVDNAMFNTHLVSSRAVSEHGNGILKGRWQSLRGIPLRIRKPRDVATVCDWIIGCCVLHNLVNNLQRSADTIPLACETKWKSQSCDDSESSSAVLLRESIKASVLEFWR